MNGELILNAAEGDKFDAVELNLMNEPIFIRWSG